MVQHRHLAKSISDAGWGNFQLILQSKAANAGKQLTKVDPKYTSQKCSGCDKYLSRSRYLLEYTIVQIVVFELDRDHNAAINIKKAAVALRGGVVVANTPEKPVTERSAKPVSPRGRYHKHRPSGRGS